MSRKTSKKNNISKIYFTHNNYDRPYKVEINNKNIKIYKIPKNIYLDKVKNKKNIHKSDYTKLVKQYEAEKIFIGKSTGINNGVIIHDTPHYFDGNSILFKISGKKNNKNHYIVIDSFVWKFTTDKNDPIVKYYSSVGNNDTPYPIAESKKNIYFMLDYVYVDKNLFPKNTNFEFIYDKFYTEGIPWYKEALSRFFKKESIYQKESKKIKNYQIIDKSFYDYNIDYKLYGYFKF